MWFKFFLAITAFCLLPASVQADRRGDEPVFDARIFMNDCSTAPNEDRCRSEQERWLENMARALDGDGNAQIEIADCLYGSCDGAVQIDLEESCAWALVRFRYVIFIKNNSEESPFNLLKGACSDLFSNEIPHDSVEIRSKKYFLNIYHMLPRKIDTLF